MSTNYEKGVNFEREVVNMLSENGYSVMRTAGSHGLFDVIAVKKTRNNTKTLWFAVMIQAKIKKLRQSKKKVPEDVSKET